jgi:hypothetical protein
MTGRSNLEICIPGLFEMRPGGMLIDLMRHFLDSRLNQSNHLTQGFASIVKDLMEREAVGNQVLKILLRHHTVQFVAFNQIPKIADVHRVRSCRD